MDAYFLALRHRRGLQGHAWAMVGVAGRDANYTYKDTTDVAEWGNTFATPGLLASAKNLTTPGAVGLLEEQPEPYIWAGGAFEVSALDRSSSTPT